MAQSTPLSYQTTMPEYPDVSYSAYKDYLGGPKYFQGHEYNRLGYSSFAHSNGYEDYDTWRTNALDEYSNRMSAYNTWLSTGAGQRASALSGNYNPSYFGVGSPSAQPAGFQQSSMEGVNPFSDMAQGVSGIFNFLSALQGLKMMSAKIAGQEAQNRLLGIEAKYRDTLLGNKAAGLGFNADRVKLENEAYLAKRFNSLFQSNNPFFSASAFGYGRSSYNLDSADESFQYQGAALDLEKTRQATALLRIQQDLAGLDVKAKEFYTNTIQELEAKILSGKLSLISSQDALLLSKKEYQDKVNVWYDVLAEVKSRATGAGISQKNAALIIKGALGLLGLGTDTAEFFLERGQ